MYFRKVDKNRQSNEIYTLQVYTRRIVTLYFLLNFMLFHNG
jgi:hypothetical protein